MIIAIDPGKSGGIAWLDNEGVVRCEGMPETFGDIKDALLSLVAVAQHGQSEIRVYLEQVSGYIGKKQPGSHMFEFGKGYGFILGLCAGYNLTVNLVRPQEWQKVIGAGTHGEMSDGDWKNKLKGIAQRIFPDQHITLKTADALLILEYARLREKLI